MDIQKICEVAGRKYGINPSALECGELKSDQMILLAALFQQWQKYPNKKTARMYIEAKANFFKSNNDSSGILR